MPLGRRGGILTVLLSTTDTSSTPAIPLLGICAADLLLSVLNSQCVGPFISLVLSKQSLETDARQQEEVT